MQQTINTSGYFFRSSQKSLDNEVHRLRKKVNELKKHQYNKSEPITDHDQYVFTKNK